MDKIDSEVNSQEGKTRNLEGTGLGGGMGVNERSQDHGFEWEVI